MFVNIVEFPALKKGTDSQFKEFKESNNIFSKFEGFISRRLLFSEDRIYNAIVEHESKDTFMKMHDSSKREEVHARMIRLFEGKPKPSFYTVIVE